VDSIRSGVEWSTLEKDWRWTEGGLMWSAGGLNGLHIDWRWTSRGSIGECKILDPHLVTIVCIAEAGDKH
jgi:hypothetical protein